VDRADTLVHQVGNVWGLVGCCEVSFHEVPEGNAVGELLSGRIAKVVYNLAGFEAEPVGVGVEGMTVLEEGLVDGFGEVAEVARGEEQCGAVPDPLEKVK
jgi:hypothetical protein